LTECGNLSEAEVEETEIVAVVVKMVEDSNNGSNDGNSKDGREGGRQHIRGNTSS
jgi:hypothetical protein